MNPELLNFLLVALNPEYVITSLAMGLSVIFSLLYRRSAHTSRRVVTLESLTRHHTQSSLRCQRRIAELTAQLNQQQDALTAMQHQAAQDAQVIALLQERCGKPDLVERLLPLAMVALLKDRAPDFTHLFTEEMSRNGFVL
jgi:hypothetical protein